MNYKYRLESWIDPRIEIRKTPGCGQGSFALESLHAGEVLIIWGGRIFTSMDVMSGKANNQSLVTITEGIYLGAPANALSDYEPNPDHFLNHSCDPNLWMSDEVTLVSRRDIAVGEELSADYAMWEADENYVASWVCVCGSTLCRKHITGMDWRLPILQKRYCGHFSPLINERITQLKIRSK